MTPESEFGGVGSRGRPNLAAAATSSVRNSLKVVGAIWGLTPSLGLNFRFINGLTIDWVCSIVNFQCIVHNTYVFKV